MPARLQARATEQDSHDWETPPQKPDVPKRWRHKWRRQSTLLRLPSSRRGPTTTATTRITLRTSPPYFAASLRARTPLRKCCSMWQLTVNKTRRLSTPSRRLARSAPSLLSRRHPHAGVPELLAAHAALRITQPQRHLSPGHA
eukprot:SAG31_NODE_4190_length_3489_cov_3.603835_3_plen_143_part_00